MKRILLLLLGVFYLLEASAEVRLTLEPKQVALGETIRLILAIEGDNPPLPDLSGLQRDFQIVGTERNMSYTAVNGQASSSYQWIIYLSPRKSGTLKIAPIRVGSEYSNAVTVVVTEPGARSKDAAEESGASASSAVMIEASVEPKEGAYVNQQMTLEVRLYSRERILDADYIPPKVDNALIMPMGDVVTHHEQKDGVDYEVSTQKYLIFAQKSGQLAITPPRFQAIVYGDTPYRVNLKANITPLMIRPIPAGITAWLPAQQVSLSVKDDSQATTFYKGTTLTRTIELKGVGVPAQLLPRLTFDASSHVAVYPEKPVEENKIEKGQWVGVAKYKVTYLFNAPGVIEIKAQEVPWFNTKTHSKEVALLPTKSVEVILPATAKKDAAPTDTLKPVPPLPKEAAPPTPAASSYGSEVLGWAVAVLMGIAWLWSVFIKPAGWGGYWAKRRAARAIKAACLANDAIGARDALLQYAALKWPNYSILQLQDVSRLVGDRALKKELIELSHALYSAHQGAWKGDALWAAWSSYVKERAHVKPRETDLPSMNPQ